MRMKQPVIEVLGYQEPLPCIWGLLTQSGVEMGFRFNTIKAKPFLDRRSLLLFQVLLERRINE